ncbi:MAG: hypothetical protein ACRC0X_10050 [Brevinema sp.]
MMVIFFLLLGISHMYAEDQFYLLREKHFAQTALSFVAQLEDKSADLLLKGKIKKPYRVVLSYDNDKGITMLVKDTEPFYEYALESQANYINMMLLPLLNTSAYVRLQKRFTTEMVKLGQYRVSYQRGDQEIQYLFTEGRLGLVDQIQYFENSKKVYTLDISWEQIEQKYIPVSVKTISYIKTRQAVSFKITNISLK